MQAMIAIVDAAGAAAANAHANTIDTIGGQRAFLFPLSPSGLLPATHFWCLWQMSDADLARFQALPANVRTHIQIFLYPDNDAASLDADNVLAAQGLKRASTR